uniref:Uncharacterized protein n=1 Tax=Anguilla anguilla TaxID=7936 RepID=A0A0E9QQR1_ANGAN
MKGRPLVVIRWVCTVCMYTNR